MIRAVVLAAGKGTRMKSARTKVLHEICGRPMLWYVIAALRGAGIEEIVAVINAEMRDEIEQFGVESVVQEEQLGTGHAVKIALEHLAPRQGRVVVACGDMPLVTSDVFAQAAASLDRNGEAPTLMSLVTVKMPLPSNFGRVVRNGRSVERIVEFRDATPEQLAIDEM
ncbi:MAG: NTP transferase domain-containing protein, partial [Candidatus Cybelea sp.]